MADDRNRTAQHPLFQQHSRPHCRISSNCSCRTRIHTQIKFLASFNSNLRAGTLDLDLDLNLGSRSARAASIAIDPAADPAHELLL